MHTSKPASVCINVLHSAYYLLPSSVMHGVLARHKKTKHTQKQIRRHTKQKDKNNEREMFAFKRIVLWQWYGILKKFNAVRWRKMNRQNSDDTKQKLAGNRQRSFANFQYDWINEHKWRTANVSTVRAPSNCDAVSAAPKAFAFMVGRVHRFTQRQYYYKWLWTYQ